MRNEFAPLIVVGLAVSLLCIQTVSKAAGQHAEADQTVILRNIEFNPNRIKVAVGDRIKFINQDPFQHDIYLVRTANQNIVLVPATTLAPGESKTVTIEKEGLFNLYCTLHGGMTGMVSTTGNFELSEKERNQIASIKVVPPIVKTGEKLFWDRGQCHVCHRVGERGNSQLGPNLQDIGFRAAIRAKKLGLGSATDYIVQSVMEPNAYLVEGFHGIMPKVYLPPIDLNEQELKAIVAYMQSQGGEVDTWAITINKPVKGPAR